jgi:radical SAM protein with 4Fe4S-binding SPASM domain
MPIKFGNLKDTRKVFIRNRNQAYENAIEKGYLHENNENYCHGCSACEFCQGNYQGNWEYLETRGNEDYFQNIYTRKHLISKY